MVSKIVEYKSFKALALKALNERNGGKTMVQLERSVHRGTYHVRNCKPLQKSIGKGCGTNNWSGRRVSASAAGVAVSTFALGVKSTGFANPGAAFIYFELKGWFLY